MQKVHSTTFQLITKNWIHILPLYPSLHLPYFFSWECETFIIICMFLLPWISQFRVMLGFCLIWVYTEPWGHLFVIIILLWARKWLFLPHVFFYYHCFSIYGGGWYMGRVFTWVTSFKWLDNWSIWIQYKNNLMDSLQETVWTMILHCFNKHFVIECNHGVNHVINCKTVIIFKIM